MNLKKLIIIFCLIFTGIFTSGYRRPDFYTINAEKNAYVHNNIGLNYMMERIYYAAVQEFKIAISLSPNRQASAVFYNNLGEAYMFLGSLDEAEQCFKDSLIYYGLNLKTYMNMAMCYKLKGVLPYRIADYSQPSKNPLDQVMLGVLYIENGEKKKGVAVLDDFCMTEPDLIITQGIRKYLAEITKEDKLAK